MPATCPAEAAIALKRPSGAILIRSARGAGDATKVGKYFVKASCTSVPFQFEVEFKRENSEWKDLFAVPLTC